MKDIFLKGVKIKIIGDSIAAGAGSSISYNTSEIIFEDDKTIFYKKNAPNSWSGLLQKYLEDNYVNCTIENKGCSGAFSYQINRHISTLISNDDELIFILMGLNDRKCKNGMDELKCNCENIIDKLISKGKSVVLLTPTPSVESNENYPNRIYHTKDVVKILRDISTKKDIIFIDNYKYVNEYISQNHLMIDDIIYGDNCENDGLHPSDYVQNLIFQNIIKTLGI